MKSLPLLLLLLCVTAEAGTNKIADACSELTNRDSALTKNCVNHAELFEVEAPFIRAVTQFHRSVEVRMKALKSGAGVDTLNLCRSTGWNLDNVLSCLRAYPTPEIVRECKKISPKEDEQLKCVREGRDTSQINACLQISKLIPERLTCLQLDVPAMATINCENKFPGFQERLRCMKQEIARQEDEYQRDQAEMKERAFAIRKDPAYGEPGMVPPAPTQRMPASVSTH